MKKTNLLLRCLIMFVALAVSYSTQAQSTQTISKTESQALKQVSYKEAKTPLTLEQTIVELKAKILLQVPESEAHRKLQARLKQLEREFENREN